MGLQSQGTIKRCQPEDGEQQTVEEAAAPATANPGRVIQRPRRRDVDRILRGPQTLMFSSRLPARRAKKEEDVTLKGRRYYFFLRVVMM